jgi:hypothetical protein
MRKKSLLFVLSLFVFFSCKQPFFIEKEFVNNVKELGDGESRPKVKLKFKHGGCALPLGICLQIPIGKESYLTKEEIDDDIAFAKISVDVNDKLVIAPEKHIYLPNGDVPVSSDIPLFQETATELGHTSLVIKQGNYKIDFSQNKPYGVVRVDFISSK